MPKSTNPLGSKPIDLNVLSAWIQDGPQETQFLLESARRFIDENEESTNFLKLRHAAEMIKLRDDMEKQKAHIESYHQGRIAELERNLASKALSNAKHEKIRIPDPPIFKGDKNETALWLQELKLKFIADADIFQSEQAKLNYIYFRTGGKARSQLASYLAPKGTFHTLLTAEDMMMMLEILFGDYAVWERAWDEFNTLQQENLSFDDFILEFNRLANELGYTDKDKICKLIERISQKTFNSIGSERQLPEDYLEFVRLLCRSNVTQKHSTSKKKHDSNFSSFQQSQSGKTKSLLLFGIITTPTRNES